VAARNLRSLLRHTVEQLQALAPVVTAGASATHTWTPMHGRTPGTRRRDAVVGDRRFHSIASRWPDVNETPAANAPGTT